MMATASVSSTLHLHCVAQYCLDKGAPPIEAPLGLKEVHEVTITHAAVIGSGFRRLLCPGSCCCAAILPEHQPLQHTVLASDPGSGSVSGVVAVSGTGFCV